jgi:hypothetical protein
MLLFIYTPIFSIHKCNGLIMLAPGNKLQNKLCAAFHTSKNTFMAGYFRRARES